jgi:cation diffusion facilitator CzcD-associated flavoprotein CzcO
VAWNVVIAGGGFGGFYAARRLESIEPPAHQPASHETESGERPIHAVDG